MNGMDRLEKLLTDCYHDTVDRSAMDERILNDASTKMKQARVTPQRPDAVSVWRRIMQSSIARVAAIVTLLVGITWMCWRSPQGDGGMPMTMLTLLNTASSAEMHFFAGDGIVHIVNEITIHDRADGEDLAHMLEEMEANYSESRRVAFTRLVLTRRWLPIYSLGPDGQLHLHKLELTDPQAAGTKVQDRIWFDGPSGRYVRIIARAKQVLFAHAFDGRAVYLTQMDDPGQMTVRKTPVTANFKLPKNPAELLGLAAGIRSYLSEEDWAPIQEQREETWEDGSSVQVYKVGFVDAWEKLDTYQTIYVDPKDDTIAKVECMVSGKPTLTLRRVSVTPGQEPRAGWNLENLQSSDRGSIRDVTVQLNQVEVGLTVEQMIARASYRVYTFSQAPHGTTEREILDVLDPGSPLHRVMITLYHAAARPTLGLIQCRTATRYITTSLEKSGYQWQPVYTSTSGFKLYDPTDAGGIDWVMGTLMSQLHIPPAPNRHGYVIQTPDDQYLLLGINGWLPSNELEHQIETLIAAEDFDPDTYRSVEKPIPDPNWSTVRGLEHGQFLTRWQILGPLQVDSWKSEPEVEPRVRADFTQADFSLTEFQPSVTIDGKVHTWRGLGLTHSALSLDKAFGEREYALVYAWARIDMPEAGTALLSLGSDDAVAVWLNGECVHENWVFRGHTPDSDIVPVTLRKGENNLVLKVLNDTWGWAFSCRLLDPAQTPPRTGCFKRPGLDPALEREIDIYRATVPWKLETNRIPGAALALVDRQGLVWAEGFGHTERTNGQRVTPGTVFGQVGTSETVLSLAILRSVQDGVLDLDEPIGSYLPEFHINSRLDTAPMEQITLRHLLGHTAGLEKQAPVGNNWQSTGTFAEHVASLQENWLNYPVGQASQVSHAGVDLAAYLLQERLGKPLSRCLDELVLTPLGLTETRLCTDPSPGDGTFAVGHHNVIQRFARTVPMLGSFGLVGSVEDQARLVQMFLNRAMQDHKPLLTPELFDTLLTPRSYGESDWKPDTYRGLGIRLRRRGNRGRPRVTFMQSGTFGYETLSMWYPEHGIGMVTLTNSPNHGLSDWLAYTLPDTLIRKQLIPPPVESPEPAFDGAVGPWHGWQEHVHPTPYRREWKQLCGTYCCRLSGFELKPWFRQSLEENPRQVRHIELRKKDGHLCVTEKNWGFLPATDAPLEAFAPGLFTDGVSVLDTRGDSFTWKNYRLIKIEN